MNDRERWVWVRNIYHYVIHVRFLAPILVEVRHRFHFVGLLFVVKLLELAILVANTFPEMVCMCSNMPACLSTMEFLFHIKSTPIKINSF